MNAFHRATSQSFTARTRLSILAVALSMGSSVIAQVQPISPNLDVPSPPSLFQNKGANAQPAKVDDTNSLGTEQSEVEIPINAKQPQTPKAPDTKRLATPSAQSTALPTTMSISVGPQVPTAVQWGPLYQFPAANTFYLVQQKKSTTR